MGGSTGDFHVGRASDPVCERGSRKSGESADARERKSGTSASEKEIPPM